MFKFINPLTDALVLSISSAGTLQDCERKFCHRSLMRTPKDPDYKDPIYFAFGRAFHEILEVTEHDANKYHATIGKQIVEKHKLDWNNDGAKISAMLRSYWILSTRNPMSLVASEIEFENDIARGKLDAVVIDDQLKWYILDIKTTGVSLDASKPAVLKQDPQLCLYGAYSDDIAKKLNLEPHKFAGVMIREIEKPRHRYKANESFEEFSARIAEKGNPPAREMFVSAEELQWREAYESFLQSLNRARSLQEEWRAGNENPGRQDTRNCKKFGNPCEFWSKCFGKTYSESIATEEKTEVKNNPIDFL